MRATIVAATLAVAGALGGAGAETAAADLRGYECTLAFWSVDWEEVPGEAVGHGSGTCTTADSPGGFTGTITYRGGWFGFGPDVGLDGTLTVEDGFNPPASESIRGEMEDLVTPSGAHLRAPAGGDWTCDDYVSFLYCGGTPRHWTAYPPSHLTSTNPPTPVEGPPRNRYAKPAVGGAPVVGTPLRASQGTWYGSNLSYTYQWRRCDKYGVCEDIAGATGQQYTPEPADVDYTLTIRVTASNSQGSTSAESNPSPPVESPDSPPAEPETESETGRPEVDDETTADHKASWAAVDIEVAMAFERGLLSFDEALAASATNGKPPYHCVASVSKKVGGLRQISGDFEGRTVRYAVKETCKGGEQVIHMNGFTFLNRFNSSTKSFYRYHTGPSYSVTPGGPVMQVKRVGKTVEGKHRAIKQVFWDMRTVVPEPYYWINEDPGELNGVNTQKTDCDRYVDDTGGGPRYLNGLHCKIYSHQFK